MNFRYRQASTRDLPNLMLFVRSVAESVFRDPDSISKNDRQRVLENEEFVAVFVAERVPQGEIIGCVTVQRTLFPWSTAAARCQGLLVEPRLNEADEVASGLIRAATNFAQSRWGARHIER